MKKELLISSLLVMSPISSMTTIELANANTVAKKIEQAQQLEFLSFKATEPLTHDYWRVAYPNRELFYKLNFIITNTSEYQYTDGGQMEYEVLVSVTDKKNEITSNIESRYFAKRIDENTFKIFDCNSTANCSDSFGNGIFQIFDTPKGKVLKFKRTSNVPFFDLDSSKTYFQID